MCFCELFARCNNDRKKSYSAFGMLYEKYQTVKIKFYNYCITYKF
jgi:hypothetical protein